MRYSFSLIYSVLKYLAYGVENKMRDFVTEKNESIDLLKDEIKNIILNNDLETNFNSTDENKNILDDFFEKTYQDVILKTLIKVKERLLNSNDYTNRKKEHFTTLNLMVVFSDKNNKVALDYLVNKYRNKILELGLDELGVIDCSYVKCLGITAPSSFKVEYSNSSASKHNYCYNLEVTFSMTKEKKLRLTKN